MIEDLFLLCLFIGILSLVFCIGGYFADKWEK